MFTGIILGQGEVRNLQRRGGEVRLTVQALFDLPNIVLGESIAINGVCLTVEAGADSQFSAYASKETTDRSNLGALRIGSRVNLERALAVGDRLGGHIVSGHVDDLAAIAAIEETGESHRVRVRFNPARAPEIIAKGSVTLDGVSLTVNDCGSDFLEVNVIPETWNVTTMAGWRIGSRINLETDVIGKYVRHMLGPYAGTAGGSSPQSGVTLNLLQENGFI